MSRPPLMITRPVSLILVLVALVAVAMTGRSTMAAVPQDVDALVKQLASIKTFAADFTQELHDARGHVGRATTGHFVLERPGRFYWRYETPYIQELIAADGVLWVYEPDLRQATRSPLTATQQGAPIAILMGDQPVDEVFRIRALENEGGLAWFAMQPRGETGDFREVLLGVDDQGVREMHFIDQLDQTTQVSFDARVFNQPVDASLFSFKPPDGVDVVEAREPPRLQ